MKITKTASGQKKVKFNKNEWLSIGKKAGWLNDKQIKTASTIRKSGTKIEMVDFLSKSNIPDDAHVMISVLVEDKLSPNFYEEVRRRGL